MRWVGSIAWFALWAIAGMVGLLALVAVIPFGVLGLITVGIAVLAARAEWVWPEALGLIVGIGALALIAGINNVVLRLPALKWTRRPRPHAAAFPRLRSSLSAPPS